MALAKKAFGGWLLARFLKQRRTHWYQRRASTRITPGNFFMNLTPLGRFSLGSLAVLGVRRVLANRRAAVPA